MTEYLTVRGGCPLGWETEIFDSGLLKNSEVSWLSFCYACVEKFYIELALSC